MVMVSVNLLMKRQPKSSGISTQPPVARQSSFFEGFAHV